MKVDLRSSRSMTEYLESTGISVEKEWSIKELRLISKKQLEVPEVIPAEEVIVPNPTKVVDVKPIIKAVGNVDIICDCHVQKNIHYYNQATHKTKMLAFIRDMGILDFFEEQVVDNISDYFYLRIGDKVHKKSMMFINETIINKDLLESEEMLALKEKLCSALIENAHINVTRQHFLTFIDSSLISSQTYNTDATVPANPKYSKEIAIKSFNAIKTIVKLPARVAKKSTGGALRFISKGLRYTADKISKKA